MSDSLGDIEFKAKRGELGVGAKDAAEREG